MVVNLRNSNMLERLLIQTRLCVEPIFEVDLTMEQRATVVQRVGCLRIVLILSLLQVHTT